MTEATTSVRKKAGIQYKLFAKEYVLDLNGARAAIAAGDSEKGADP
jgi:phage terminase small subunit